MNDSKKAGHREANGGKDSRQQQQRSRITRHELVEAARQIFARDGFEIARLEDIAAAAGKTRGAFYAHFRDKEDVFFAIFEDDLAGDERKIRAALAGKNTAAERIEAITRLFSVLLKNRRRMLLTLEFKLYAIRRPHHKRLATLHHQMKMRCAEANIDELLPELRGQSPARKRETAAQFGSLVDGLALNRLFDPRSLRETQLQVLLKAGVTAAFEQGHPRPRG